MGGMSCGEVSLVPWEILKKSVNYCISLPDEDIARTMKLLGNGNFSDEKIIAGENSAPGVISLIASCNDEKIKKKIGIDIEVKPEQVTEENVLPATEQKNTEEKAETKVAETPKKLEEKKEDSKISTELKK